MTSKKEAGMKVLSEIMTKDDFARMSAAGTSTEFGIYISELALENVFGNVWTRDALDRRSRSLVTLGILIALRAHDELHIHFKIALNNGLTVQELEEVIYQASCYAGFPAAASARNAAIKSLREVGAIK